MYNLFEPTTAAGIVSRLDKVEANTKPLWGRMNASQMMAHCQRPFEVFFGEKKLKRSLMGILFGKIAKKDLFGTKPWRKNMPTDRQFKISGQPDFDKEKTRLVEYVNRFATDGINVTSTKHPFFGHLSSQEWAELSYRHLDHHLQQFGA